MKGVNMDITSLLGWITAVGMLLTNIFTSGRKVGKLEQDFDEVKKNSHTSPCPSLQDTKNDIIEIKTDLKWIRKALEKMNGK